METRKRKKKEPPNKELAPEHAEWLAQHRGDNQNISAKLYRLLKTYPNQVAEYGIETELLVGIAFSLWRSAFLSDKTGYRSDTTEKAVKFLAELLQNNAIVFSSERNAVDWAFNYFATNAKWRLEALQVKWRSLDTGSLVPPKKLAHRPKDRWEYLHAAFCVTVNYFEDLLIVAKNSK